VRLSLASAPVAGEIHDAGVIVARAGPFGNGEDAMRIAQVAFLVPDYDEGLAFFAGVLGFSVLEDADLGGGKRWIRVRPPGGGVDLLLARAVGPEQTAAIGRQGGGRVFLFLETDDLARDHAAFQAGGVVFEEPPRREAYGAVAVFRDPWSNRWDLIEPAGSS
jgi:catechol 2,3-dioxygenase-like lactoylglutathione lyase family enzyme